MDQICALSGLPGAVNLLELIVATSFGKARLKEHEERKRIYLSSEASRYLKSGSVTDVIPRSDWETPNALYLWIADEAKRSYAGASLGENFSPLRPVTLFLLQAAGCGEVALESILTDPVGLRLLTSFNYVRPGDPSRGLADTARRYQAVLRDDPQTEAFLKGLMGRNLTAVLDYIGIHPSIRDRIREQPELRTALEGSIGSQAAQVLGVTPSSGQPELTSEKKTAGSVSDLLSQVEASRERSKTT
jgi:hypothetical protein